MNESGELKPNNPRDLNEEKTEEIEVQDFPERPIKTIEQVISEIMPPLDDIRKDMENLSSRVADEKMKNQIKELSKKMYHIGLYASDANAKPSDLHDEPFPTFKHYWESARKIYEETNQNH